MDMNDKVTIEMDRDIKRQAQELFSDLGMDLSTAVNIFLRQALQYHGLPFEVTVHVPNEETVRAIEEVQKLKADPNKKSYTSFAEIVKEL